jgi:NAD(P)-dependent dehydrogenase (short-subunit alcohol dehydrogenase family)
MNVSLSGRTALITGGTKGLGLASAKRFVEAGAKVVIAGRGQDALDAAVRSFPSGQVHGVRADVSVAADVTRLFGEAVRVFGQVDIVMNNAGVARAVPFEQLTDELLQADL